MVQSNVIPALMCGFFVGMFTDGVLRQYVLQPHMPVHVVVPPRAPCAQAPTTAPATNAPQPPTTPAPPPATTGAAPRVPNPDEYPEVQFACRCATFKPEVERPDIPPTALPCPCEAHGMFEAELTEANPDLSVPRSRLASFYEMHTWAYAQYVSEIYKEQPHAVVRKEWEVCAIAKAIDDVRQSREGGRGVGFSVGAEPLVSWFVSRGAVVTMAGERPSGKVQWSSLVDAPTFREMTNYKGSTLPAIDPEVLTGEYDYVWSNGAMTRISEGYMSALDFMVRAMDALKPGGVAVHAAEVRIDGGASAWDGASNFYSRDDIRNMVSGLESKGYKVAPLEWHIGMEGVVDAAPFERPLRNHVFLNRKSGVQHTSNILIVTKPLEHK